MRGNVTLRARLARLEAGLAVGCPECGAGRRGKVTVSILWPEMGEETAEPARCPACATSPAVCYVDDWRGDDSEPGTCPACGRDPFTVLTIRYVSDWRPARLV